MISSDVIRGYNDFILLSILKNGPSYGYEISKTIREKTDGLYIIKETTLYSSFARLEKNGYILPSYGDISQGSRRTYFTITEAGKNYLQEKIEEWHTIKIVVNAFTEEEEK